MGIKERALTFIRNRKTTEVQRQIQISEAIFNRSVRETKDLFDRAVRAIPEEASAGFVFDMAAVAGFTAEIDARSYIEGLTLPYEEKRMKLAIIESTRRMHFFNSLRIIPHDEQTRLEDLSTRTDYEKYAKKIAQAIYDKKHFDGEVFAAQMKREFSVGLPMMHYYRTGKVT